MAMERDLERYQSTESNSLFQNYMKRKHCDLSAPAEVPTQRPTKINKL